MGRPQKPFTVEVKRGRRGALATRPVVASKPTKPLGAKLAPLPEPRPAPAAPPSPRRILDAIEPAIKTSVVEAAATVGEAAGIEDASAPLKRRRGRPPKAASVPQAASSPASSRVARGGARVRKEPMASAAVAVMPVAAIPVATMPVAATPLAATPLAATTAAPPREARAVHANGRIPAVEGSAAQGAKTQGAKTQARAASGRITHGDRVEAATSLPRGERWKRRVPKVLW